MKESITIHTYYCPKCGKGMESKEALISNNFLFAEVKCPDCERSLNVSGIVLLIAGFFIILFSGMVYNPLPLFIGAIMAVIGFIRIIQQILCQRKHKKNLNKSSERNSDFSSAPPG